MFRPAALYACAALIFFPLDMIWLGFVARDFYKTALGDLLLTQPRWGVALAFYALYLVGLTMFALLPAAAGPTPWLTALGLGAAFGLIAYATYDLTNLATLKGYPWSMALVDMAWGAVLSGVSAALGVVIAGHLGVLR